MTGAYSTPDEKVETLDIIVIGAGISGINAAYRFQNQLPSTSFTVLEGRDVIGGTWDLFRYPGIRSDSEMWTLGFSWHSWPHPQAIAGGDLIRDYLKDAVSKNHIERRIRFRHKVISADWSSKDGQWNLVVDNEGNRLRFKARWVIMGTGYYDYENPLEVKIPGLDSFKGKRISAA